jgi:RNA polymerase sigma-70 factor (ECF subfamily)
LPTSTTDRSILEPTTADAPDSWACGLAAVTAIEGVERLAGYPFYPAAVAELELRLGRPIVAKKYFALAKDLARNDGERRFLERRLDECARLSTS